MLATQTAQQSLGKVILEGMVYDNLVTIIYI